MHVRKASGRSKQWGERGDVQLLKGKEVCGLAWTSLAKLLADWTLLAWSWGKEINWSWAGKCSDGRLLWWLEGGVSSGLGTRLKATRVGGRSKTNKAKRPCAHRVCYGAWGKLEPCRDGRLPCGEAKRDGQAGHYELGFRLVGNRPWARFEAWRERSLFGLAKWT